jgi:hypothetical protein
MMEAPRPMLERIAGFPVVQRLLSAVGIEPQQFRLFLRLLRTLSERQEFMGNLGVNRFAIAYLALFYLIFIGLPMGLMVLARFATPVYLLINLTVTTIFVLLLIVMEAPNTLFNPTEASALAHQPVHAFSYVAAKITHLLLIVLYLVPALAGPAALCGIFLKDARWFYPVTHFAAALFAGLFTAFLVCALCGWLFRVFPPSRLKNVSLWLQLLGFAAMPALGGIIGGLVASLHRAQFDVSRWAWFPLSWFVEVGLLGTRVGARQLGWLGLLSMVLTAVVIWLGLRGFSKEYLQRVPAMLREHVGRVRRSARAGRIAPLVRFLTGSPEGVAAFGFTSKLMRRDWQFRRSAVPMALPALGMFVSMMFDARFRVSPFVPHKFSPAHVFPQVLGFMLLMPCAMISYSDWHQGSWIFLTAPLTRLRAFARGIYAALWLPGVALPHICFLPVAAWFWGWKSATLFSLFSVVVVSFYLALELLLISGLPFASPFKASRSALEVPVMILGLVIAGFFVGLQWLVFQIWWVALAAGLLLVLTTWFTARLTLRQLEDEICLNLQTLRMGPTKMFKGVE